MNESIAMRIAKIKNSKITKSQRKLIEFMEAADYKQIMYYTITELARATGIGEATILRFCRLLGFDGYQFFKLQIARELSYEGSSAHPDIKDYRADLARVYENAVANCVEKISFKQLDDICEYILNARRVSCFGVGNSYVSALELYNKLLPMGIPVVCEADTHIQNILASVSSEGDLLIVYSVSGSTKDVVEVAEFAKRYGVKIILITSHEASPLSKVADIVISTGESGVYTEKNSIINKTVQLYVGDLICEALYRKDKERFDAFIYRSRNATVGKLI